MDDAKNILLGRNESSEECLVKNVSSQENRSEYTKLVECIDIKEMHSELSVKDYLYFYMMVSGCYTTDAEYIIQTFLCKTGQEGILSEKIDVLSKEQKIVVRFLAAYLKGVRVFIGANLLATLQSDSKRVVICFLKRFTAVYGTQCILLEEHWDRNDQTADIIEYNL